MKVEISHNVDWVPGQSYNYLAYEFHTADSRIRARAYLDTMSEVSILGRLLPDGRLPFPTPATGFLGAQIADMDGPKMLAAMDPTKAAEFDVVLEYLRERFSEIKVPGMGGYRTLANGLTREEQQAKMSDFGQTTKSVDLKRDGEPQ